jgi:hypothetical protein
MPAKSVASSIKSGSVTSLKSKTLRQSETRKPKTPSVYSEASSIASSRSYCSIYKEKDNEEDQWANINKFNNMLYQQEQMRRKTREQQMKYQMKCALDAQIIEKNRRKEIEVIDSNE